MIGLIFGLAMTLGSVDQGIFSDLGPAAQIAAPNWQVATGALWLRLDPRHRVLTLYQGETALTAYPLVNAPPEGVGPDLGRGALLALLAPQDATDVRTRLDAGGSKGETRLVIGPPPAHEDQDGDGVVNTLDVLLGAKKLCLNQAAYIAAYRVMKYPGGDVPRKEGVCTDTLVRALRNAGWDVQRGVHEDALRKPRLYPLEGKAPDANIDHRRIRMMLPWFRQNFVQVAEREPYLPGDILLFDTFPNKAGPDHAGIVSDRLGPSGKPMIVNNWTDGYVEQEMDLLGFVPVTHRFRVPMKPQVSAQARAPVPQPR
jgi:uncharacterized protein YijF (DUF1287 family)